MHRTIFSTLLTHDDKSYVYNRYTHPPIYPHTHTHRLEMRPSKTVFLISSSVPNQRTLNSTRKILFSIALSLSLSLFVFLPHPLLSYVANVYITLYLCRSHLTLRINSGVLFLKGHESRAADDFRLLIVDGTYTSTHE